MKKTSQTRRTAKFFGKGNARLLSSMRKSGLETLETRELLSASTFADVAALSELTANAAEISSNSADALAPIDLSNAVGDSVVVTSAADDGSEGTLRYAIENADDGATITFDSALNGATITLNGSEIDVNKSLTIDGTNANITLDANSASRVFRIYGAPIVNIYGLTLVNGVADKGGAIYVSAQEIPSTVVTTPLDVVDPYDGLVSLREAATVYGKSGDSITFAENVNGQTINLTEGSIILTYDVNVGDDSTNVTVDAGGASRGIIVRGGSNVTVNGVSVNNADAGNGDGGAFVVTEQSTLTLKNLTVSNSKAHNGGAISAAQHSVLNVDNCNFDHNTATSNGGAWYIKDAVHATFNNITASYNTAYYGGFGYVASGTANVHAPTTATVTNATLTYNQSTKHEGGGFFVAYGNYQGYQHLTSTYLTLENVYRTTGNLLGPITGTDDVYDAYGSSGYGHSGTISFLRGYSALLATDAELFTETPAEPLASNAELDDVAVIPTLNLVDVTINSCQAELGGGVYALNANVSATRASFGANGVAATYQGGAIAVVSESEESGASLTITDSNFSENVSERGGAVYFKNGEATITGTRFDANETTLANGGAIAVVDATMTVTDVAFVNNRAARFGGAIYAGNATVTINNAESVEVAGNQAQYGGVIYDTHGTIAVQSGVFASNTATASGGAIYSGGAVTATAVFAGNTAGESGGAIYTLGGATIADSAFNANTSTGAGGAVYALGGVVTVTDSSFEGNRASSGGALRLAKTSSATFENARFTENASTGAGGAITVSATPSVTITGGAFSGNVARNTGGAIYATTNTTIQSVGANYVGNTATKFGGALAAVNGANLTVTGGEIKGGSALAGGAIYVANASAAITGSTISENTASSYGAGIYGVASAITATGATLAGNTATHSGGAIFATQGSVALSNATVTGNASTTGAGGAIYVGAADKLELNGAVVVENTAKNSGGAIFANSTNVEIKDAGNFETVFSKNESTKFGGALYVAGGGVVVTGGEFAQNIGRAGGAIYVAGDVTVSGAKFTTNSANTLGGAIYTKGGVSNYDGVEFVENAAITNGGALYLHSTETTVTNATFTGNTSTQNGGAIEMVNGSLTITTASFSGNAAERTGGAIYQLHGTTNLSGVSFTENSATTKAGALYVGAGASTISGSTFSGNASSRGTAIAALSATSLVIDGEAFPTSGAIEESDLSSALLDEAFAELFVEELD